MVPVLRPGVAVLCASALLQAQGPAPAAMRAAAQRLHLAASPAWRALLHLRPGSHVSDLQDPAFWLDPSHDPERELDATLEGLTGPQAAQVAERFPARADWLRESLGVDLPRSRGFEQAWQRLAPRDAFLVFADAYTASPASMFGHTLLVIRPARGSDPLAQAVNFAAKTGDVGGAAYAWRGMTGHFDGAFSLMPYHEKLQEYAHAEHRDLWEHPLQLSPEALRRLTAHIWEVKGLTSPYYFFTRNCAFQLLHLLQVARPDLDLFSPLPFWILPLDTLRSAQAAGLLGPPRWRPSLASQVRLAASGLAPEETRAARQATRGSSRALDSLAPPSRARALDLATAWLQAERTRGRLDLDTYQSRQLDLLKKRAALGIRLEPSTPATPPGPLASHPSQRVSLGTSRDGDQRSLDLSWRPVLHDWMDPQAGQPFGSEVTFLDLGLRLQPGRAPTLGPTTLLRVRSFRPVDAWFQPPAWTAGLRWDLEPDGQGGTRRHSIGDLGMGFSVGTPRALTYVLALGEGRAWQEAQGFSLGVGSEAGLILDGSDRIRLRLHARRIHRLAGNQGRDTTLGAECRFNLQCRLSLGLQADHRQTFGRTRNLFGFQTSIYF